MAIAFQKDIMSLDGLKKTILNDKYVYRWLLHLFTHPNFLNQEKKIETCKKSYDQLNKFSKEVWVYNALVFASFIGILITRNFLLLIVTIIFVALFLKSFRQKKKIVADMGMALIAQDFSEEEVGKTSLYQIGEFYSEKYKTLSLVDAIYRLDKIYRATFLITFILACYIILMKQWWHQYLVMTVLYILTEVMVNTPFFYKRLEQDV